MHVLLSDSTASARHSISSKLSDRVRQSIIIILNTHHHNHNYQQDLPTLLKFSTENCNKALPKKDDIPKDKFRNILQVILGKCSKWRTSLTTEHLHWSKSRFTQKRILKKFCRKLKISQRWNISWMQVVTCSGLNFIDKILSTFTLQHVNYWSTGLTFSTSGLNMA